jgi:signal transduction histidine kinase
LRGHAQLVSAHSEAEERLETTTTLLDDAQGTAKLREQFIAVLGHDLRQPLNSIQVGTHVLQKTDLQPEAQRTVQSIARSCARMNAMVEDVRDFARGRLGAGIPVATAADDELATELAHVADEVRSTHPRSPIELSLHITQAVICDRGRIAQLLANLLVNAVTHGSPNEPVQVAARTEAGFLQLSVANRGPAIPADSLPRLFKPFARSANGAPRAGLGLGLYIAAEIARAHDGTLDVTSSTEDGTRFVFRMPLRS